MSTPPYVEIAKRLKGLRDALEMSAQELASKVGVKVEEVEAYESGKKEIPVSYLFEVAKACGVDLTVLIAGKEAHLHTYALVRKGKGLSVERRKDYDYKSLAYKFSGRKMEPFIVKVPPKKEEDITFNEHSGQEFIYMLKGKLEIRLGDDVLILEPGDSLYFSSRTPHALRGLDGEAEFLDVII
ncbi:transcriptional regulator, XRE family with cupin sensor [Desulfonauticus submarinus]|uniref:Transcriptional regulator, XRE family with cupin sensor n=1 Tax=Desulfonauticus submarinus TaxID=206665 RepID=A0A1H0E9B9_9BACT|nr:XRE family transcriptional regulator [Desulfonauticus submarinus]SDN78923.1 transcriptional regulator, XRE family with cupin sensor [Desulfonauticus submarinus]